MLEQAAAKRWGVSAAECAAQNHEIMHKPTGRKLGYGEVAADAAALPTPPADQVKLKDPGAFRYIGKGNVPLVDLFDITAGHGDLRAGRAAARHEIRRRGAPAGGRRQGRVVRRDRDHEGAGRRESGAARRHARAAKFNPLGGVAVIAKNTWAAIKGREALKIVWDDGPNKSYDSKAYKAKLEEQVRKPGKVERNDGDADAALKSAARVITAEYYAPHLAHATMEPPAAVARREGGKWDGVGPGAEPGRRTRRHRQGARHQAGGDGGQLHAARRRLRPQVEMRLRDRGGVAVA